MTTPSLSTLNLQKATTLAYSRSIDFQNGDIAFKLIDQLTFQVLAHNISNNQGVMPEIQELFTLQNSDDWLYLIVNGVPQGMAKLVGFSLPEGNFVKAATCSITFLIYREGDSLTSLGGYYEDYAAAFVGKPFVESLSESISYSVGENSISYSKQVSIKFSNSTRLVGSSSGPVQIAQDFAKKIFDYDASNNYAHMPSVGIEAGITDLLVSGYRKIRSESLNLITNECSFTETVSAQNVKSTYSHAATQSITIDKLGVASVTESGTIKGLTTPILASAEGGYASEVTSGKTRMLELFNRLSQCGDLNMDGGLPLLVSSSKTVRGEEGVIEYSITADNDPKKANSASGVIYERTIQISTQGGYESASENGTITGMSKVKMNLNLSGINRYVKYLQARAFFTASVVGGIKARLDAEVSNLSAKPVSRSENHSPFNGTIEYSHSYSAAPEFSQNTNWKKVVVAENSVLGVERANEFGITNFKTILQRLAGNTKGERSTAVSVIGYRVSPSESAITSARNSLLTFAKTQVNFTNDHPSRFSYNFSYKNNVAMTLSASYTTEMEEAQL